MQGRTPAVVPPVFGPRRGRSAWPFSRVPTGLASPVPQTSLPPSCLRLRPVLGLGVEQIYSLLMVIFSSSGTPGTNPLIHTFCPQTAQPSLILKCGLSPSPNRLSTKRSFFLKRALSSAASACAIAVLILRETKMPLCLSFSHTGLCPRANDKVDRDNRQMPAPPSGRATEREQQKQTNKQQTNK